jgi:hypothetical protein
MPTQALKRNIVELKDGAGWSTSTLEGYPEESKEGEPKRQCGYFAVFDG